MTDNVSRGFKRLSAAAATAVYLLIVVGAVVRVTGSGLGCPDWPLCYGRVLPPPEVTAWIEFSHRVVAASAGLLMIATLVTAWRRCRNRRWIFRPVALAVGLLVVQVPLGGLIVATELEPLIVAFHLGMAMLIFAGLLTTAVAAHRPGHHQQWHSGGLLGRSGRFGRLLLATQGAVFVVLLTGALVVGSNAQLACPTWPLCPGGLFPPLDASPLVAIHLLHRYTVAAVGALVLFVIVRAFHHTCRDPSPRALAIRGWAALLGGLFAAQVMVGAIQVFLQLPPVLRALHVATASGVWGVLVILAVLTLLDPVRIAHNSKSPRPLRAAPGS